jgi:hypothetical protein
VKYFNSLNKYALKDSTDNRYSSAKVTKTKKEKATTFFKGYLKIFDRFATNKMTTLNVLIENYYCKKEQKTVILFKFSPKEFKHKTGGMLEKTKLHKNVCH